MADSAEDATAAVAVEQPPPASALDAEAAPVRWEPRRVVRRPPALEPPYTLAEDVFSLPCGALARLMDCFRTDETDELRAVSVDAEAHVAGHAWDDLESRVWNVRCWRAAFPRAVAACLPSSQDWSDADFTYLAGIKRLAFTRCDEGFFTPAMVSALAPFPTLQLDCSPRTLVKLLAASTTPANLTAAATSALQSLTFRRVEFEELHDLVAVTATQLNRAHVCTAVMRGFKSYLDSDEKASDVLAVAEGFGIIERALRTHMDEPTLVVTAAEALTVVTPSVLYSSVEPALQRHGIASLLVEALRAYADAPSTAHVVLAAAAHLAVRSDVFRRTFAAADGLLAAMAALRRLASVKEARSAGCMLLNGLSRAAESVRQGVVAGGGARALISLTQCNAEGDDAGLLVLTAVNALGSLALGSPSRTQALLEAGAVSCVLAAMVLHHPRPTIGAAGCRALGAMAAASETAQAAIHAAGGVAAVLTVLGMLPFEEQREEAVFALNKLAPGANGHYESELNAGGVGVVVACLKSGALIDEAVVAAVTTWLKEQAASKKAIARALAAAGGVPV